MIRRPLTMLALAAAAAALALPADAGAKWVVPGKGFGHGVGLSQWGTFGFAKEGRSYKRILKHYYRGVEIGNAHTRNVRVLIASGVGTIPFSGATRACGRNLRSGRSYSFGLSGSGVQLRKAGGAKLAGCGNEGSARGGASVRYEGVGTYRGQLIGRNVGGSLYAINKVGVEGYIRGVIPNEVPASWPAAALRTQAVAARSYALTTRLNGNGYDLYDDVRSQVYSGRSSEHRSTNRATEATSGEVIRTGGGIATAFFFSTSGGRTENSEFVFAEPRSYLKSVDDPFDHRSPYHRWRERFSNAAMESKLSGLFSGNLQRIRIVKTGRSPRIVRAKVVGSADSTKVSGGTLQFRLGLRSTWAKFRKR